MKQAKEQLVKERVCCTKKILVSPYNRKRINTVEQLADRVWSYARRNAHSLSSDLHTKNIRAIMVKQLEEYEAEIEQAYSDCLELLDKIPQEHRPTIPERFRVIGQPNVHKLDADLAKQIKELRKQKFTLKSISEKLKVGKASIMNVLSGRQFAHITLEKE